jgi:AcrR family transcriptional regulator
MSIIVEHEKRRHEILEKALDVFIDSGFENATFQKIADRCGITRTTLYLYYKNKKEIFNYSIKLMLANVEEDILQIVSDGSLDYTEKITNIILDIFSKLEENRRLLSVLLDYLLHISKNNIDPEKRVRRRTLRLRRILASLVIEGVKSGGLKQVNIKIADDYLFSLLEAAIFRLVVLQRKTVGDLRKTAAFTIRRIIHPSR